MSVLESMSVEDAISILVSTLQRFDDSGAKKNEGNLPPERLLDFEMEIECHGTAFKHIFFSFWKLIIMPADADQQPADAQHDIKKCCL
eukprot:6467235-Amphidinium_carterae.1